MLPAVNWNIGKAVHAFIIPKVSAVSNRLLSLRNCVPCPYMFESFINSRKSQTLQSPSDLRDRTLADSGVRADLFGAWREIDEHGQTLVEFSRSSLRAIRIDGGLITDPENNGAGWALQLDGCVFRPLMAARDILWSEEAWCAVWSRGSAGSYVNARGSSAEGLGDISLDTSSLMIAKTVLCVLQNYPHYLTTNLRVFCKVVNSYKLTLTILYDFSEG